MTGTARELRPCELCGETDTELRPLWLGDFCGLCCRACRQQLEECQPRRYSSAGEETEPGE